MGNGSRLLGEGIHCNGSNCIAAGLLLSGIQPAACQRFPVCRTLRGVRVQLPPGCEAAEAPMTTKGGQQPAQDGTRAWFRRSGSTRSELAVKSAARITVFHLVVEPMDGSTTAPIRICDR